MSKLIFSYFFKTNLSAFRTAILNNNTNRICRILDVDRDHLYKEIDSTGNTALLLAIKHASPLTVRLLLQQGARPDQTNFITFQTPLSLLASKVYGDDQSAEAKIALEVATILLDHGAYVDKPSSFMYTDENGKDYVAKETPLTTAVRNKNIEMATLFIERKANVNYIEKQSQTRPINFAITNGDAEMFDLLENAGASCRTIETDGKNTLLHWFCCNTENDQYMSLLKKLINKGCDIDAENNIHRTPLMLAAKSDMINTCHILLNSQARTDKTDSKGYQAVDLAKPNSECFKLLRHVSNTHQPKLRRRQITQTMSNDAVLWRKPLHSTHRLTTQISEPGNHSKIDEIKIKHHSLNTKHDEKIIDSQNNLLYIQSHEIEENQVIDGKYKRMWEILLQTKQKKQRIRDSSQQRTRDSSQIRPRDLSQQRPRDSSQIRARDSSQIRPRDSSQIRPRDLSQQRPRDSSQIRARDSSQIRPRDSSQI